ncbi:MAG: DUF1289 domain-containing protein [Caldimonas sp.]
MKDAGGPVVVASPCTGICSIEPASGWCDGCLRTIEEIAAWGALDDRSRREVLKRLPARRATRRARSDAKEAT